MISFFSTVTQNYIRKLLGISYMYRREQQSRQDDDTTTSIFVEAISQMNKLAVDGGTLPLEQVMLHL